MWMVVRSSSISLSNLLLDSLNHQGGSNTYPTILCPAHRLQIHYELSHLHDLRSGLKKCPPRGDSKYCQYNPKLLLEDSLLGQIVLGTPLKGCPKPRIHPVINKISLHPLTCEGRNLRLLKTSTSNYARKQMPRKPELHVSPSLCMGHNCPSIPS